ncbi:MAG: DEAD/DEAH box helicase [Myxococcota bacterium]|nr:DEAD/DEAH box helicase [Myxococcota bacterium]
MDYRGFTLDRFQAEAIEALQQGHSVLVCAPTGTGKTVVADWMVEEVLGRGKQVVYTAPIKALSNQKYRDYCTLLGEERTGLVTGDLVIRHDAPCRVMTTEILRNMLLTGGQLPDLGAVIIDEIHFLDDKERGTVWEEVLIYLPQDVQVVGLSATLANVQDFAEWLGSVRGHPVTVVEEYKRAVPLTFRVATREAGLLTPPDMDSWYKNWARRNRRAIEKARTQSRERGRGRGRGRGRSRVAGPTRHGDVFDLLFPEVAPFLYFVFSRKDAELMARGLTRSLHRPLLEPPEQAEVLARLEAFWAEPGGNDALDDELAHMFMQGVACHHAGLHVQLKTLVEQLYEHKLIKVLYCTGTFALGINMPARTAVFDGLERFDGQGMIPLPAREFMQMAGRAGRRGLDDEGLVVIRTNLEDWPDLVPPLKAYLRGSVEPVRSRFSLSFNSVVNLLHRHPPERIRELVERSFLAFHRAKQAGRAASEVDQLEAQLVDDGWIPGSTPSKKLRQRVKKLRRLRTRAAEGTSRTWAEFEEKVHFLVRWGYLDEDRSFNAGATALMSVQISEIFVVECILEGVFDGLDPHTLFGVLTGMTGNLPRAAVTREGKRARGVAKRITQIHGSDIVRAAEHLSGVPISWDHQLVPLGRGWAAGKSLSEVLLDVRCPTDISGSLVGAFRRAKDLCQQLRDVWKDDPDRRKQLDGLIKGVTRDEVEVVG